MGDPQGIGPEVLLKALSGYQQQINPIIFGARDYLNSLAEFLEIPIDFSRVTIKEVGEFPFPPKWGEISRAAGKMALSSLEQSIIYCNKEKLPVLTTAPVCKESLVLAGFNHPGQTEFLGQLLGCPEKATMAFFSNHFHVLLITVHIPFKEIFTRLTKEQIVFKGIQFWEALRHLGIKNPRIAVCGLNPHASESGLFGNEEASIVEPSVEQLNQHCSEGTFTGPLPADIVFFRVNRGEFDGAVALYHDQGLIPLKMIGFDTAVNATLGLPIVRTSPDHGTGFDIAGTRKANPSSMLAAIDWGLRLGGRSRVSV
jgi:4-hydroxythreonine-4-phosphate dehydrogenase